MKRLFDLMVFPLELLGQLFAALLRCACSATGKFLLSPWGLLVPATCLIALFLATQIAKTPKEIAAEYVRELETCDDDRVPVLVDALLRLDEVGLPGLIHGLRSEREAVFLTCRNALQDELKRWKTLDSVERRNRSYRVFSAEILDQIDEIRPSGRIAVCRFVYQMLHELAATDRSPETASRESRNASGESLESHRATRNCEEILVRVESVRRNMIRPNNPQNETTSDSLAHFDKRALHPVLMASNGRPFEKESPLSPSESSFDELAVNRAERLIAYHASPLYRKHQHDTALPEEKLSTVSNSDGLIASMSPTYETLRQQSGSAFPALFPEAAESGGKIAENYAERQHRAETGISKDFLSKIQSGSLPETEQIATSPPPSSASRDDFLPPELREIDPEKIPLLSSARLMRMLQHPDDRCVGEARKTLIARDGFRDIHLKLAFRLYHPTPSVREEIVSMLPNIKGIQSGVWLSELLNDPNDNVRYRAASFLATGSDPRMHRLLIEKGKKDPDQRIVNLADRLIESTRKKGKR